MGRQQKSFGHHPRENKDRQVNIGKSKRVKNYYINRKLLQKHIIRAQ